MVVGRYLTPIAKVQWPDHLRTIVDCDDASYRYAPNGSGAVARAIAGTRGVIRSWQTRVALRKFDHVFFCAARDIKLFDGRSSTVLPNVVPIQPQESPEDRVSPSTILIVGSMWYAPNRLGLEWFLRNCWPRIADRCPHLSLRVVGPAPSELRDNWARSARVEAPGYVEDLGAEYARAAFAVAPIHYGGGTCIKFLEAAAYHRACVITPRVFEGFQPDFENGVSTLVAETADEMVELCVTLCEDRRLSESIAWQAHRIVVQRYSIDAFRQVVHAAVASSLSAS